MGHMPTHQCSRGRQSQRWHCRACCRTRIRTCHRIGGRRSQASCTWKRFLHNCRNLPDSQDSCRSHHRFYKIRLNYKLVRYDPRYMLNHSKDENSPTARCKTVGRTHHSVIRPAQAVSGKRVLLSCGGLGRARENEEGYKEKYDVIHRAAFSSYNSAGLLYRAVVSKRASQQGYGGSTLWKNVRERV